MEITGTRNERIVRSIEESKIPLLPFELALARCAMKNFEREQDNLGKALGGAMGESSETWHDNAPAEAIASEAQKLTRAAEQTMRTIGAAEVFDYDANPEDGATLGSLIDIRFDKSASIVQCVLTGVSRKLTPEISGQIRDVEDVDIITIGSAMGKAIFGKKVNEEVTFISPNGRAISFTIVGLSQLSPVE